MKAQTGPYPPGFGPSSYGTSFADVYDQWYSNISDADATARFMADRCDGRTILELGVGTGRLVSALQGIGLTVVGLDSSAAMLRNCAEDTLLAVADISTIPLRTGAGLGGALCAFNTLFNLPTAGLQQAVLAQAASVVGGPVVIEAMTGAGLAEAETQSIGVSRLTSDSLVLAATIVNHEAQTITGQHVDITEAGIKLRPWHLRWSTPAELDAMAARAGLRLVERYADWDENSFEDVSRNHVSVYRRQSAAATESV
ncbi:MAG: class I SAM-dependent methyltransferase [Acidimicrobiales bacterium]